MNWKQTPLNRILCLAAFAGASALLLPADAAQAEFVIDFGQIEANIGETPDTRKSPGPPVVIGDPWATPDKDDDDIDIIGHIDIPEIDKDGDKEDSVVPPVGGLELLDLPFNDGPKVEFFDLMFRIGDGLTDGLPSDPTGGDLTIIQGRALNGVPSPGSVGLLGLGVLAFNRRRRA